METPDQTPSPAADSGERKRNKISLTLPSAVLAALDAEGDQLEMPGPEYLKHLVISAYTQPSGVSFKLKKAAPVNHPDQQELPLEA